MIRPAPRTDRGRERSLALAGAMMLLVSLYGGLRAADVPVLASGRALIRQLDPLLFERYSRPPPPDAAENETPDEAEREMEEAPPLDQEVVAAMDQISAVFGEGPQEGRIGTGSGGGAAGTQRGSEGPTMRAIEGEAQGTRFESLFGSGSPALPTGAAALPGRDRPARNDEGIGLRETAPPPAAVSASFEPSERVQLQVVEAEVPDGPAEPEAPRVEASSFEAGDFDRSAVATLQSWMGQNPGDLPVGVKVHLKFQPSFETAVGRFSAGGRDVEIYLMLNPAIEELHIVLVEGDRSVYLIDRGFQAENRSLREGSVRRLGGEIVAVDSRAGAASGERAREFYEIFLSWWDVEKQNVRD